MSNSDPHAPSDNDNPSFAGERQGVQVIARAATLLRVLQHGRPEGLSLGDLAKATSLPKSTVQRIVDALNAEGLVLAASPSSGVRLGPALVALAAATRFHIAEAARDTLRALSQECGETVDLSLVDQDKAVFIEQLAGTHRLIAVSAVGVAFPLHSSANGKAMLAAMTEEELAKVQRRISLAPITPHTITSWAELHQELALIREQGVAYDLEENSIGICAVSTAIRSSSGDLAAISIPAPTHRFHLSKAQIAGALVRHSSLLQSRLGR